MTAPADGPQFDEEHLPDAYLPPPFAAPHGRGVKTWERNWNLFYIDRHWTGRKHGKYSVLREWVALTEDKDDAPSRQLIQASIRKVWLRVRFKRGVDWTAYCEKIKAHLQSDLV